jgi:hypothetical protein
MPMGSIMWDDDLQQAIVRRGRPAIEAAFARQPDSGTLDAYLDYWPIRHVRAGLPPILFLIAENEQENPPVLRTNKKFVDDARALGNSAEYVVLAGRNHYSAIHNSCVLAGSSAQTIRALAHLAHNGL